MAYKIKKCEGQWYVCGRDGIAIFAPWNGFILEDEAKDKVKELEAKYKLEDFRKIVANKQHGKVDGQPVDTYSASAVLAVYDKLGEQAQKAYLAMSPEKMVSVAFKLLAKFG